MKRLINWWIRVIRTSTTAINLRLYILLLICLSISSQIQLFLTLSSGLLSSNSKPDNKAEELWLREQLRTNFSDAEFIPAGYHGSILMDQRFAAFNFFPSKNSLKVYEELNPTQCEEPRKIGFLKTHKTGSSTIQNILLRFGMNRNKFFVLPFFGNLLYMPNPNQQFNKALVRQQASFRRIMKNGNYDIFTMHAKWNHDHINDLLGKENVTYFTVLRDPTELLQSMYIYYQFEAKSRFAKGLNFYAYIRK